MKHWLKAWTLALIIDQGYKCWTYISFTFFKKKITEKFVLREKYLNSRLLNNFQDQGYSLKYFSQKLTHYFDSDLRILMEKT